MPSTIHQGGNIDITFAAYVPSGNTEGTAAGGFLYGGIYLQFYAGANGTIQTRFNHDPATAISGLTPDAWHTYELRIDWTHSQGELLCEGKSTGVFTFTPNTAGGWGSDISLYGNNSSIINTVYFDNITLSGGSANASTFDLDHDGVPDAVDPLPLVPAHFAAPVQTLTSANFNGTLTIDSNVPGQVRDAAVGDEVAVYDPQGVLCGRFLVGTAGQFGPLTVYGDDPGTSADEGASAGDALTFRVWDAQRHKELPARTLKPDGSRLSLTWSDNGGANLTLQGLAQSRIGVLRPFSDGSAKWYLDADGNGSWGGLDFFLTGFGVASDHAVVGDWNGDGITDPGVFRAKNGQGWWYFDANGSGAWESGSDQALQFGLATDIPVVGDWNGDGKSDFGVFRSINGKGWWYFDSNGNRKWDPGIDQALQFGLAGDIPVVGDWNGDGKSDFGVFRIIDGKGWWFFDSNGNRKWDPGVDQALQFGNAGDIPVVGDWNGDGKSDFGVMRDGVWYLDGNGDRAWERGTDLIYPAFGLKGDQPVSGVWR